MGVIIPNSFQSNMPSPGDKIATFYANEAGNPGSLVSLGTAEPQVKLCDVGDTPIGWSQGSMVANEWIDVTLYAPIWNSDVDAGSSAINYGNVLTPANDGKVKKAVSLSTEIICGIAIRAAAASGQVLYIPIVSTPDPVTT